MRFQYEALQPDGRVVTGLIEAPSERSAHRDLLKRGVQPTAIAESAPRRPRAFGAAGGATRTIARRDYATILKQLHTLIGGGIPIAEAVTALAEASDRPALAAAYADLNAALRRGDPFPAAFSRCFPAIPTHLHRMIAAGDLSGRLAEALADAAAEAEHAAEIRAELRQALIYPLFLVGFGVLAVVFIFVVVVPRFAAIFQGKLDTLPLLSYLVIGVGMWLRQHLALTLALGVGAAASAGYALMQPQARAAALALVSRIPLLRSWLLDVEIARWAAVLARLLENRVPLLQSLELARGVPRSRDFQARLSRVERDVRAGIALGTALDSVAFLTGPTLTLIRVGERSGNLAGMVRTAATIYEDTVRQRTRAALTIIEPVSIVLIGGVIGLVAAAIFLAITTINNVPGI